MRTRSFGRGHVDGGSFPLRRHRRNHQASHWELRQGRTARLVTEIRSQGFELGDGFVMPHVAAAAGGLVDQERHENRYAKRNGEPDLPTSPHRADSMRRY